MAALFKAAAVLTAFAIAAFVTPAWAQLRVLKETTPKDLTPAEAEVWPWPAPDPQTWWDDPRPKAPEAADPLGERRVGRRVRDIAIDNGIDPAAYRLWGLPALQVQALRGEEMILEVWVRPARSVRQAVIRVTVRDDGKAFVQARAGEACCEPGIGRRVGFDAVLAPDAAARFLALRRDPMWDSPRDVLARDPAATDNVCVDGTSYDLTLVVPGRARALRRDCDEAEIGQAADALDAAVGAALGRDPRFDVLFRRGSDFALARAAYGELIRNGGTLRPDPEAAHRVAADAADQGVAPSN